MFDKNYHILNNFRHSIQFDSTYASKFLIIFLLANMKDCEKPRRKFFYRLLISASVPET